MGITHCTEGKNLQRKGDVKIGHQSCVYANAMHTELELCTPMGVGVVFTETTEDNLRSEGKIPDAKEM